MRKWLGLGLLVMLGVGLCSACGQATGQTARTTIPDWAQADPHSASMNLRGLPENTNGPERFLVVGHLYGSIQGDDRLPAQSLLAKLPDINALGVRMLVSLGDLVKHSAVEDFDLLDQHLLGAVDFPVYNTVGNHDVENRALYEQRYGATYYSFRDRSSWMIFLDTEIETCQIDVQQQAMLAQALEAALQEDEVRQIFIFMHKTLFFQNDRLFELKKEKASPNVWDCYGKTNFEELTMQWIEPAARKKPVYLFAGDVGANGNLSPYYERHVELPLTLIMTGIGDLPSDSAILVTLEENGPRLEVYSLTGQPTRPLETYTADYWTKRVTPQ